MTGKTLYRIVPLVSVALALGLGCSSRPGNMEITPRDQQVYRDPGAAPLEQQTEERMSVAILVSEPNDAEGQEITSALDSTLTDAVAGFAFFTIVERSNLGALQRELTLETLDSDELAQIEIPTADYLITARIASTKMKPVIGPRDSYEGIVHVDFRFYEKLTDRVVLTKNIEGRSPHYSAVNYGPEAVAKLAEAAQEAAKAFAVELGHRYAPEARVVETRGEGKVARITIGSNYGLAPDAKVEFYRYVDNSDVIAGAEREPSIIGYGKVIEVDQRTAWVEIKKHEKANVFRGHYVRVAANQEKTSEEKATKGFGEGIKAMLR